ncbi:hypothetical protein K505DRAFT_376794 [Melanomma pulvis-pyrius CBS 109.77]|uniref:Uncharacterized protein n=1 Tax=Melanomma pulvis-pyrius CBS 109.77 TaxID=1314802 RepID=A0A6A6X4H3_9PLEO|nr:hypothetical protein K505DRAFT_376794 [Melanomma pulvis-pyrius CBS 109.77]
MSEQPNVVEQVCRLFQHICANEDSKEKLALNPYSSLLTSYVGTRKAASLLPLLATAVPPSILALALTNVPAVSRLLWSEFLDDKTPAWFTALPTDVQQYLSGEFGPTTRASNTAPITVASSAASISITSSTASASPTALGNARGEGNSGLPLWAKIVIGIAVPLFVIGLIACIILCCCRRRRSRRRKGVTSRTPTPAFISSSNQGPQRSDRPAEHVPLRGGYYSNSSPDSNHRISRSSHHLSSSSDDFRTPVGGPSYEDMQPTGVIHPAHRARRDSRQSLNSLHSVPEVPEPMHQHHHRGATDATSIPYAKSGGQTARGAQPNLSTAGQGIYAGYNNPYHNYDADYRPENPFDDHSRQNNGYMSGGGNEYRGEGGQSHDTGLFIPAASYGRERPVGQSYNDSSWPLKSTHEGGYSGAHGGRNARRNSWETGDDYPAYKM